jgi:hypothetical protein
LKKVSDAEALEKQVKENEKIEAKLKIETENKAFWDGL